MYRFPDHVLKEFKSKVDEALRDRKCNPIAAFDADGTLWASDVGENFFKYQFKNELLKGLPADPWAYYQNMYANERSKCYLWLAQINRGVPIEQVRKWARESVKIHLNDMGEFNGQKEFISYLHKKGVKVYIVTASVKWAVEPAAELFQIPPENVIGIETKIENGLVTDEQVGPITHGTGKVDGLLEKTGGKHPFLAAGNTQSDRALVESATHLKLVIGSAPQDHEHFETEQFMQNLAKEKGWLSYQF